MIASQHYRELPERMFEVSNPSPSPAPKMIQLNHSLLAELGEDPEATERRCREDYARGYERSDPEPAKT